MHGKAAPEKVPTDRPHLVLVGAGTSHLALLRGKAMCKWLADASVTLLHPTSTVLYSGMLPACIAGEYPREELTVDLASFCMRHGIRFIQGIAERISPEEHTVRVVGRGALLRYDVLALSPGSRSAGDAGEAVTVRPLEKLLEVVERWEPKQNIAVVGGGASGAELAAALAVRGFSVTIFERSARLLPELATSVAKKFARRLSALSVAVRTNRSVKTFEQGQLYFEDGNPEPFEGCLWATGAAAPAWLKSHRDVLPLDDAGFVRVDKTLRVVGLSDVFASGDGASIDGRKYARNGVVAVHQGRTLGANIDRLLRNENLEAFSLERSTLWILNGGKGYGVAGRGAFSWSGMPARKLKERIDRQWMEMWQTPAPVASTMLCEGCGGKTPAIALEVALVGQSGAPFPAFEDVGVWRTDDGWCAGSVDALTSWTADPYRFGEVATLHALSDAYAKGLGPEAVLVAATLPRQSPRDLARTLEELDRGIRSVLANEGVALVGGHTLQSGQSDKLALSVTVVAAMPDPSKLLRKDALNVGDALVLTKALGTGIALAAAAQGACPAKTLEEVEASMRLSNRDAARTALLAGAIASTDVTGFGLAATILEMAHASKRLVTIATDLPMFTGIEGLYQSPLRPSLWEENRRRATALGLTAALPPVAFDPQTSGGLLVALPKAVAEAFAKEVGGWLVAHVSE